MGGQVSGFAGFPYHPALLRGLPQQIGLLLGAGAVPRR